MTVQTLWIGDSHLEAMIGSLRDGAGARGWAGSLVAHRGWSTGRWAREGGLAAMVAVRHPDVVVVLLGTNDNPVDSDAARRLLAQAGGAKVVWFGPFHSLAADAVLGPAVGAGYVSGAALARGLPFAAGGNVHLTAAGYEQLADRLLDAVAGRLHGSWKRAALVGSAFALVIGTVIVVADRPRRRRPAWEMPTRRRRGRR